jgi:phage terminase Nu1 subunit (DNA packaging protein)
MVDQGLPFVSRPGQPDASARFWEFDTAAVLRWMVEGDAPVRLKDARTRLAKAMAGLNELQYAERAGYMVDIEEVVSRVVGGDAIVKSRLLAVPNRLAQRIAIETDAAVVENMVRKEIEGALDQLDKDWKDRG